MIAPPSQESEAIPRIFRVFVSSTFNDMQQDREELVKRVFPKLRRLCEARGVIWEPEVDLRWGVTEKQTQRRETLPLCLELIKRCRPYFIGLLGERYGWVPAEKDIPPQLFDEQPWLKEHLERSVTELEFIYGVLCNPKMADHAFFYLRDPAYVAALPDEEQKKYLERPTLTAVEELGPEEAERRAAARRDRLAALKETVRLSGFPVGDNYPDPRRLGEMVYEDLKGVIERLWPEPLPPSDSLDLQAAPHEALAANFVPRQVRPGERPQGVYLGRPEDFARLDGYAAGREAGPPLVVLGESGVGKSALLANWMCRYREAYPEDFVLGHFIGADADSTDWDKLVHRVMGELKRRFQIEAEIPDKPEELPVALTNFLSLAGARGRVVIIIDALNQLADKDAALDLGWLPPEVPANIRFILSTLPGRALKALERRGWTADTLIVASFSQEERLDFIFAYLKQYAKELSLDLAIDAAAAPQCANPLYLRTLLEEMRVYGDHDTLRRRLAHYLQAQDPAALFALVLQRWSEDYDRDRPGLVQEALTLIWAARRGLSQAELLDLLRRDGRDLPPADWEPFLIVAEPFLVNRGGFLDFFHDYLRQAAKAAYLVQEEDRQTAHHHLAHYFKGRADPAGDSTWIGEYPRGLTELPYHLFHSGQGQSLFDLLCDITYLDTRCIHSNVYDLVSNYDWIEQRTGCVAKYWQKFLRRHAQSLSRYRGLLFTLVYHEGFTEAQEQAHRLAQQGKWQRPWLRTHPMWLPPIEQADRDVMAVSVITECRLSTSIVPAVAMNGRKAFFLAKLGEIRVIDLVNGRELDLVIRIRVLPLKAIFSSEDGQSLAVAYGNGEADLLFLTPDGENLPVAPGSDAIRFNYRVPESEKPVFAFIHDALWYQDKSGVLSSRRLSNPGDVQARSDLDNELGDWELSGITSLGMNLVISARCGTDTTLIELQDLKVDSSLRVPGADVTTLCCYDPRHVAVGLTDFTLRVLDIETGFTPAAPVQLKELIACMTPTNNHLLWFTEIGGLRLWSLQEPEKVQKVHTVGLKTAGLQALASDKRGELYAVATRRLAACFSIEQSQGKPRWPVLALVANADSPDQYLAIQQRQDGLYFVDSPAQSVECRVTGDPSLLLFAYSGDGSALGVRILGQGFVFKPGNAGVCNVPSIPEGITGVAGDPDGGFWLTGSSGAILFFHEQGGLTKVQQIDLRMISRAQLLCGHQTLTWVGHCTEHSPAGTDNYYALVCFRKERALRGTLQIYHKRRLFALADGLLTAFIQDLERNRLLFIFQGGKTGAHFLRFGTPEQFINGSEQMVPLVGIDYDIDQMRLSPDGRELYALSSRTGTLFRLDPENFQCTAVFSATEPITDMSLNYAPDGSLLLIQNKTKILRCLFQKGDFS